jgi:hypothetical protein
MADGKECFLTISHSTASLLIQWLILCSMLQLLATANMFLVRWLLSTWRWRQNIPLKRWFLQEPYSVTSQKMAFFTVTVIITSNLTEYTDEPQLRGGGLQLSVYADLYVCQICPLSPLFMTPHITNAYVKNMPVILRKRHVKYCTNGEIHVLNVKIKFTFWVI